MHKQNYFVINLVFNNVCIIKYIGKFANNHIYYGVCFNCNLPRYDPCGLNIMSKDLSFSIIIQGNYS